MTGSVRVTGHFGEWIQGRLGPEGPVVLITLVCQSLGVRARRLASGTFSLRGNTGLDRDVAVRFFGALGVDLPKAQFDLTADARPGSGVGVSTASLLALAETAGVAAPPDVLAAAALVAEGAVDPLMLKAPDQCLWASRDAKAVRDTAALPAFDVVGGFWGAPERTEAADRNFPDALDLIEAWEASSGDVSALAEVVSASASRTTALRGPLEDPTSVLADKVSALGHARAHTGSARALLFAPGTVPDGAEAAMAAAGYDDVFQFRTGGT